MKDDAAGAEVLGPASRKAAPTARRSDRASLRRSLTHDDIKELIHHESPTGKKCVAVLPKITQESMVVGEKWGRELAMKVMTKLQAQQTPDKK
jgi:hypothetical protein